VKTTDRSTLRIADLKQRRPTGSRLMNMKIPAHQWEAIAQLARQFGATKTGIVIALLNAGIESLRRLQPTRK
jgi:hypothetical protein